MSKLNTFGLLVLLLMVSPAHAAQPVGTVVVAETPEKFELLVDSIHQEMAPGKRYEFLNERDRVKVDRSFEIMSGLLNEHGAVDAMPIAVKTKLFSEQEKVNGLLARNSDDRLVCQHVAPVGSHIPMTTCHTVRALASSGRKNRDQFEDMTRKENAYQVTQRPGGG